MEPKGRDHDERRQGELQHQTETNFAHRPFGLRSAAPESVAVFHFGALQLVVSRPEQEARQTISRRIRPRGTNPPARCSLRGFSRSAWRRRSAGEGLKARMSPIGPRWGSFDSGRRGMGLKRTRHDALGKCQRRHGDDHRQADDAQPEPEIRWRFFRVVHLKGTPEQPSRFPISSQSLRGQAHLRAFNRIERHRRANPSEAFGLPRHGRRPPRA